MWVEGEHRQHFSAVQYIGMTLYSTVLMFTFQYSADSYPERFTGVIRVKCLAQALIDRYFTQTARGFEAVIFRLPAQRA